MLQTVRSPLVLRSRKRRARGAERIPGVWRATKGQIMIVTKRTIRRSSLVAPLMTLTGMALQTAKSRFILRTGPPPLEHLVGVTTCYIVAAFALALGFFLTSQQLPGRNSISKGVRYSLTVFLAVWISGFINLFAIDFGGGWNLLSSSRIEAYWMALCDLVNFMLGGLMLGFIARSDGLPPVVAPLTRNLAVRITAGAVLLPVSWAALFHVCALALPSGYDLSGERWKSFYVFLFVPLALAGAGTALLHVALRSHRGRSIMRESSRVTLFVFWLYWVPNAVFVLFFGFTWQVLVDFLIAGVLALYLTVVTFELLATLGAKREGSRGSPALAARHTRDGVAGVGLH